jgi:adenine C2-methylase RlmN of 23S rRNA A2503 and tRNA A37
MLPDLATPAAAAPAVFMGMGEPLLNLRAVAAAARFLIRDLGIGARHVTISTVGVPNAIGMLADILVTEQLQATLAVSLHAPNQALRQRLVPRRAFPTPSETAEPASRPKAPLPVSAHLMHAQPCRCKFPHDTLLSLQPATPA